jgi:hypothetical protein
MSELEKTLKNLWDFVLDLTIYPTIKSHSY